jgi:hypothetical protein
MNQFKALGLASQLLLVAGLLLFIDLFFSWQRHCGSLGGLHACGSAKGWHGWGVLVGLLVIALLLWEGAQLGGVKIQLPVSAAMVSAGLAAGVLLFTVIKFLVDNEVRHWPSWIGLILAIVIGIGGWLRWTGGAPASMRPAGTPPPS